MVELLLFLILTGHAKMKDEKEPEFKPTDVSKMPIDQAVKTLRNELDELNFDEEPDETV